MRELCIDGKDFTTIEEIQTFLQQKLDFPDYYGGNLSALYDMLTDLCEETTLRIYLQNATPKFRGYLERVARVCLDAMEENPVLKTEVWE